MKYRRSEAKDAARAQFRGVWAAITTPFTPEGELDEAGLRRNMRYYTDELAIDGVFCTGTMGELTAVTKVDGRVIGDAKPGPMAARLSEHYRKLTASEGTPI